jgi:hypothetical protein
MKSVNLYFPYILPKTLAYANAGPLWALELGFECELVFLLLRLSLSLSFFALFSFALPHSFLALGSRVQKVKKEQGPFLDVIENN